MITCGTRFLLTFDTFNATEQEWEKQTITSSIHNILIEEPELKDIWKGVGLDPQCLLEKRELCETSEDDL